MHRPFSHHGHAIPVDGSNGPPKSPGPPLPSRHKRLLSIMYEVLGWNHCATLQHFSFLTTKQKICAESSTAVSESSNNVIICWWSDVHDHFQNVFFVSKLITLVSNIQSFQLFLFRRLSCTGLLPGGSQWQTLPADAIWIFCPWLDTSWNIQIRSQSRSHNSILLWFIPQWRCSVCQSD